MVPVLLQQEFITSNSGIFPQRPHEKITFYSIFYLFFILKIGTLDVYRFVITCSNINAGDDDDDDDDDSNDNKISLFTLDILLAHGCVRAFFSRGDPYQGVFVIPGCWLYRRSFYRGVFFSPFLMNSSIYRDVHYLGSR